MAQSGYTPISLYHSSVPSSIPSSTNLVSGELAINIADGKLYYLDNVGALQYFASAAVAGYVPLAGGTMTGPLVLSGAPTTSNQAATKAYVDSAAGGGVPSGVIAMWSGSIGTIPVGWYLCDGTNSTPDLRDRFIVGAGSSYAVGATGGSANATLVSHSHTVSASGSTDTQGLHSHAITDPGHNHAGTLTQTTKSGNGPTPVVSPESLTANLNYTTFGEITGISIVNNGSHSHGVSVAGNTSTDGSSATNANLPPYYALAYIMKA